MNAANTAPIIDMPEPPAESVASLEARARALSRRIGDAKRTGQPVEHLIAERRDLTAALLAQKTPAPPLHSSPPAQPHPTEPLVAAAASGHSPVDRHAPCANAGLPVTVRRYEASDAAPWDAFVRGHRDASVYHLIDWRAVCQRSFGHECPYLLAETAGQISGVLPLVRLKSRLFGDFLVSLPYFNYGGPLAEDAQTEQALLQAACGLAQNQGSRHLELRDTKTREGWPSRTDKVAMWLDLPGDADALWQRIGSKVRAQVKKAQSGGMTFRFGGPELLDDFYRVFARHMRDLGTPVYSKRFFSNVLQTAPGKPVLVVGRDTAGEPVSVALLLQFGQRMEVPWASTLRRAHGASANMALYWKILTYACEQGCHQFDFGRSTVDAPTYRFKKQWGAVPVPLHWHYWLRDGGDLPRLNPDNPKYRLAIGAWKHLPVWLTRLVGPPIVKNLP